MTVVDLTAELAHGMLIYPAPHLPGCEIVQAAWHETHARSVQKVTFGTHISTHVDAPLHAIAGGLSIDRVPVETFVGDAAIINLPGRTKERPITRADLELHAGVLAHHSRVILHTGWSERAWGTMEYFTEGPHLEREAARYLASNRLLLCGTDFPNIDSAADTRVGVPNPNHVIFLGTGAVLLENIINVSRISKPTFRLTALPLRLIGGDGSPCRAIAEF